MWWQAQAAFDKNKQSVLELLDFDRDIITTAVDGLRSVADHIEEAHGLHTAVTMIRNRARLLDQVREGESLKPKYQTIFNQAIVLLVSYFDSAMHEVFRSAVAEALRTNRDVPAASKTLQVSWRSLQQSESGPERLFADLLVLQENISFQDMQSIVRAFDRQIGISLPRTSDTDNIILGQAARHAIVHAGAIADERMVKQVSGAKLRTVKASLPVGKPLHFLPTEIEVVAASMGAYVARVCEMLDAKFGAEPKASPP